jgi:hypothetical protein
LVFTENKLQNQIKTNHNQIYTIKLILPFKGKMIVK